VPPNPADLLSTGRIRSVIAEAGERFEMVLIDGPPMLGLADAALLSAAAGAVIFVVESGKTRTRGAIEALNRLEATGTHILGALLTKASEGGGSYGYGHYGYGYGYGRGKLKHTEFLMIPRPDDEPPGAGASQGAGA
jgi:Mrp family chromosome partitioning ATPase